MFNLVVAVLSAAVVLVLATGPRLAGSDDFAAMSRENRFHDAVNWSNRIDGSLDIYRGKHGIYPVRRNFEGIIQGFNS